MSPSSASAQCHVPGADLGEDRTRPEVSLSLHPIYRSPLLPRLLRFHMSLQGAPTLSLLHLCSLRPRVPPPSARSHCEPCLSSQLASAVSSHDQRYMQLSLCQTSASTARSHFQTCLFFV